jgi:hypothetical protein
MGQADRSTEQLRALRSRARRTSKPMKIKNCQGGEGCPEQWDALNTDDGELDSRLCRICGRRVQLCVSDQESKARIAAGECVVLYREQGDCIAPAFVEDPLTGASLGAPRRRWLHLRRDGWDEKLSVSGSAGQSVTDATD